MFWLTDRETKQPAVNIPQQTILNIILRSLWRAKPELIAEWIMDSFRSPETWHQMELMWLCLAAFQPQHNNNNGLNSTEYTVIYFQNCSGAVSDLEPIFEKQQHYHCERSL